MIAKCNTSFLPFYCLGGIMLKGAKPMHYWQSWQLVFARGLIIIMYFCFLYIFLFFFFCFPPSLFALICRRLFLFHCHFNLITYLTVYKADFVLEVPVHRIDLPSDRNLELVWYMPQIRQNIGYLGSSHVL